MVSQQQRREPARVPPVPKSHSTTTPTTHLHIHILQTKHTYFCAFGREITAKLEDEKVQSLRACTLDSLDIFRGGWSGPLMVSQQQRRGPARASIIRKSHRRTTPTAHCQHGILQMKDTFYSTSTRLTGRHITGVMNCKITR